MFNLQKPRGLTMFYLETRNDDGKLNGIEMVRLKNKLGKFVIVIFLINIRCKK